MGKLIVIVAIVAAIAYAWNKGLIGEWLGRAGDSAGKALDSTADSVKRTQRDATKTREAEPPAEKK